MCERGTCVRVDMQARTAACGPAMLVYLAWRTVMRGAAPLLEVDVGVTSDFAERSLERRECNWVCHELKDGFDARGGQLAEIVAAVELWALVQLISSADACIIASGALWTAYALGGAEHGKLVPWYSFSSSSSSKIKPMVEPEWMF